MKCVCIARFTVELRRLVASSPTPIIALRLTNELRPHIAIMCLSMLALIFGPTPSRGAANGTLSGTLRDPSGAVVPRATSLWSTLLLSRNTRQSRTDRASIRFPTLPVGHYDTDHRSRRVQDPEKNEFDDRYRCGAEAGRRARVGPAIGNGHCGIRSGIHRGASRYGGDSSGRTRDRRRR